MRVRAQEMAKQYAIKKWRAREQIAKQREITNGRAASANEGTKITIGCARARR